MSISSTSPQIGKFRETSFIDSLQLDANYSWQHCFRVVLVYGADFDSIWLYFCFLFVLFVYWSKTNMGCDATL